MEQDQKKATKGSQQYYIEENSEEGFITNEPPGNEYPKIEKNNLDQFPYLLIGQLRTIFNIPLTPKTHKQGVGILIAPNIVLTAAHILCQKILNENKEKTIFNAIEVSFAPACSENFNPLNKVIVSDNFYINDKYIDLLRENDPVVFDRLDEKYINDWALIFLPYNVGDHLVKLFDVDENDQTKLTVRDGLYQYFHDSVNNLEGLNGQLEDNKAISLIAYIEKDYDNNHDNYDTNSDNDKEYEENNERHDKENIDNSLNCESQFSMPFSEANVKLQEYKNGKLNVIDSPNQKLRSQSKFAKKRKSDFVIFKNSAITPTKNEDSKENFFNFKQELSPTLTMCETKGFLYFPKENYNEKFLYYQFHTLKGQSGAPLFYRSKTSDTKPLNYLFMGLHIRRGPNNITPFQVLTDFQYDVESKVMSSGHNKQDSRSKLDDSFSNAKINVNHNGQKKKPSNNANLGSNERRLRKEHGECEYNIALKMSKQVLSTISKTLSSSRSHVKSGEARPSLNSYIFVNKIREPSIVSNYIMINLFYGNQNKLKGLFNRNNELLTIFKLAGKLLNIDKKFICLELKSSDDIKYNYHKQIYEFDKDKKLQDFVKDDTNSLSALNSEYCLNFDIGLNVSLLADFHAEKILNKVSQVNTIEISALRKDPKKYGKYLTVAIFAEIEKFNSHHSMFGSLFQTMQSKLGLK